MFGIICVLDLGVVATAVVVGGLVAHCCVGGRIWCVVIVFGSGGVFWNGLFVI